MQRARELAGGTGYTTRLVDRLADSLRQCAGPVLLVIDDLHHLEARAAPDNVRALLALAPAELRLLLITRSDRWLGLHRLRVAGDLTELRAARTWPSPCEEADKLLSRRRASSCRRRALARLHEPDRGMGGRAAPGGDVARGPHRSRPLRLGFSGSERTVAEYLTGEVLAGQPPAVRRMLRRTSVLERVNGPLANLLSGGPTATGCSRTSRPPTPSSPRSTRRARGSGTTRCSPTCSGWRSGATRQTRSRRSTAPRRAGTPRTAHGRGDPPRPGGRGLAFAAGSARWRTGSDCSSTDRRRRSSVLAALPGGACAANPELSAVAAADRLAAGSPRPRRCAPRAGRAPRRLVPEVPAAEFRGDAGRRQLERARTRGDYADR